MGSSSHIHGQIRGHPLGEYPPQTRGCRRAGEPWGEESEERLPHPRTTLGTSPTPNLVPSPVVGPPRGVGAPLRAAGKVWKGFGNSRELPPGSPRVDLRKPRGARACAIPAPYPLLPRLLKEDLPIGEGGVTEIGQSAPGVWLWGRGLV